MDAAKAFYGEAWWAMSKAEKLAAIEQGIRNPEHFCTSAPTALASTPAASGYASTASAQRSAPRSAGSPSPSASRTAGYSPVAGAGGRRYSSAEEAIVGTSRQVESADLAQWAARASESSLKSPSLIAEGLDTLNMLESHRVERHDVSIAAMRRMATTQEQYTEQLRARDREHEDDLSHISEEIMAYIAHMKSELHGLQSRYVEELTRLEHSFAKDRERLLVSNRAEIRKCVRCREAATAQTVARRRLLCSDAYAKPFTRSFARARPRTHSRARALAHTRDRALFLSLAQDDRAPS